MIQVSTTTVLAVGKNNSNILSVMDTVYIIVVKITRGAYLEL